MNTRYRHTLLLVTLLLAAFFIAVPAFAQDTPDTPIATAEPTAEPAVDTVVTTTTTTTGVPVEDIGLTLTWALAVLALWQTVSMIYAVTVEKTIKPMIYSLTDNVTVRHGLLVAAVFLGAFGTVQSGGVNLFVDAPVGLFVTASPGFLLVLNSVFVAAGTFISAELWATLEAWLKKAKAVADVFIPSRQPVVGYGDAQPRP